MLCPLCVPYSEESGIQRGTALSGSLNRQPQALLDPTLHMNGWVHPLSPPCLGNDPTHRGAGGSLHTVQNPSPDARTTGLAAALVLVLFYFGGKSYLAVEILINFWMNSVLFLLAHCIMWTCISFALCFQRISGVEGLMESPPPERFSLVPMYF